MDMGLENYEELLTSKLVHDCPACPHPGVNLPSGWEDSPHRYMSFIELKHV